MWQFRNTWHGVPLQFTETERKPSPHGILNADGMVSACRKLLNVHSSALDGASLPRSPLRKHPPAEVGDWTKFGEKGTGQDEAASPLMSLGWRAAESPRQQRHI